MTNPSEDLLVTTEGVDEGSAASTAEESHPAPVPGGPVGAADPAGEESEATAAPPVDTGVGEQGVGPGQQLEAGEG